MKIQDAKPGDVVRSEFGDVYFVDRHGALWILTDGGRPSEPEHFCWKDEISGALGADDPFTRLVPEQETP